MPMTPAQLLAIATDLAARLPANTQLVRSQVGNLSIVVDGEYIGYVELKLGKIVFIADQPY